MSVPQSLLSEKPIPLRERLIFALDVPGANEAYRMIDTLGDSVLFYKLGLELLMSGRYFELVDALVKRQKKVFIDLKFFDVAETVSRAVRQLRDLGASFATIHPSNDDVLKAVAREKADLKILVVTVLTSLTQSDMEDLGFRTSISDVVLSRAKRALELGCDGVISSPQEAAALREQLGSGLLIVSPGIRPGSNDLAPIPGDDQKRVATAREAFASGADYIVVGRPIRNAADPQAMAERYQAEIAEVFGRKPSA